MDQSNIPSDTVFTVEMITGAIAFFTLIVTVVINGSILLSDKYTGSKRLFDSLVLLTAVDLVTAMIYGLITAMQQLRKSAMGARYLQWFITVPLLIIAIIFYLDYLNTGFTSSALNPYQIAFVVGLSIVMLVFSCLAEFRPCERLCWLILSLVFYVLTMVFLAVFFTHAASSWFFWIVVVAFGLYGVVHLIPEMYRESGFNILDTVTKVGFSLIVSLTLLGQA